MSSLKRLGEKVAQGLDEAREKSDLVAATRGAFLEQASGGRTGATRVRFAFGLAAAGLVAAAAALLLVLWPAGERLTATVGDGEQTVEPGAWITAPAGGWLPVRFSDGSVIELEPLSGARMVDADERGARILLEKGTVRAEVIHRLDTSWALDVGPYEVKVTGTRFDAAWDPERQQFSLDLHEGGVMVRGPMVTQGQRVEAGNRFRAWVGEQRVELASLDADRIAPGDREPLFEEPAKGETPEAIGEGSTLEDDGEPDETDTSTDRAPARAGADAGAVSVVRAPEPPVEPTWKELASRGEFQDAIRAAELAGFEKVLIGATPRDLKVLADAARLSGDFARAEQCYVELRQRYPGSADATKAAFALGRMAFDQQHLYSKSAKWLDLYLKESGGGGLAREALGRLVEARYRAGDRNGALQSARRYLASYPDGPHAAYARKILNEADSAADTP